MSIYSSSVASTRTAFAFALLGLLANTRMMGQTPEISPAQADPPPAVSETAATAAETAKKPASAPPEDATGAVGGAALRNENVFASKLDTDTQKAADIRLGGDYVVVSRPLAEGSYYATELGARRSDLSVLSSPAPAAGWHGNLFESLQNSVFNARTYFQAGPVMPSRRNNYGGRFTGVVPWLGALTGSFEQVKDRGMVNGNVLVPLPSEHTPLATDPAVRAIVARFLDAFPDSAPNRLDFDPRALNTNAPQTINSFNASLRLDRQVGSASHLSLYHLIDRQSIDAFQLVAGANPNTDLHSQKSRVTYRFAGREHSEFSLGAGFERLRSDLEPDSHSVGPSVMMGRAIENLGPDSSYPLNRAENRFYLGALGYYSLADGKHRLTFGGDMYRYQLNGLEQSGQRGSFGFSNNFGRSAMENLLMGTPTTYDVTIGNMYRGFRNLTTNLFVADQWTVNSRLQLYVGLRHNAVTAPTEVNRLNTLPFGADGNNFSPRFSFAYRAPGEWIARGSYTISYGSILPVTYSQARYNPPGAVKIRVNNPSLVDPLNGIDLSSVGVRSALTSFSSDLVSPYSHQYNLTLEHSFGDRLNLRAGYFGSRTMKLLRAFILNRAEPVAGVPLTTATVNQRRPDQRYYDITQIANGGVAYLDAAQVSWSFRPGRRLTSGGAFTFSKAMDQGGIYTSTAANRDILGGTCQWQYECYNERKSLSDFDSPRSFSLWASYDLGALPSLLGAATPLLEHWQFSGSLMLRTGTPFHLATGSDAPGFGNTDGQGNDRPNLLDTSILGATVGDPETSTQILSRDKFSYIAPGEHAGNLGYNVFRKQSIANVNAAVSRQWKWGAPRAYSLEFRAEAFNLGNHAQFDAPQYTLTASTFGKITNTLNNGRVLQLRLGLAF
jgi:hypothetical protein